MTGISYVTNDKDEKTIILIDLVQLRKTDENELVEFLEDLDDTIFVELSKGQTGRSYKEVRKEILKAN